MAEAAALALVAALAWGVSDFSGGMQSRRSSALSVGSLEVCSMRRQTACLRTGLAPAQGFGAFLAIAAAAVLSGTR
jgi:hypothetical protein